MSIPIPITKLAISTWQFNNQESDISYPVIVDDIAYFGASIGGSYSNDPTSQHHLCAVNVHTGEQVWQVLDAGWCLVSPTVVDGVIYSGSYDSYIYALEAKAGQVLWQFKTEGRIKATPVVCDGIVYCGSSDQYFYALDAQTGIEKWRFKTEKGIVATAITVDGFVYFGTENGCLYALDALTGEQRWLFKMLYTIAIAPTIANGVLYLGNRNSLLYAIDAYTGEEKWHFQADAWCEYSPVVLDGTVFCASMESLYALDATTGTQKWHYACVVRAIPIFINNLIYVGHTDYIHVVNALTGVEEWLLHITGNKIQKPLIINGMLHIVTSKGCFLCVDLSDEALQQEIESQDLKKAQHSYITKWKFKIEKTDRVDERCSFTPVLSDGLLYCVSGEGYVYAVDAQTGSEQWKFKAVGSIFAQPVISDGLVYIVSYKKSVFYALDAKTGLEKWKFKSKDMNIRADLSIKQMASSPVVADGVVYFGCGHKYVYALDSKTGIEKWHFKTDHYVFVTPIIVSNLIYIASGNGTIYTLDIQTGINTWELSSNQYGFLSWIIANDFLYISHRNSNHLYAFDISIITKSQKSISNWSNYLSWRFDLMFHRSFLAIIDDLVYHNEDSHWPAIVALDYKTGAERWKLLLRKSGYFTVNVNEGMYVADDHSFYLLDAKTGTVLTEWKTDVAIASCFVKTENNIYFFGSDGTLTALELVPTTH